MLEVEVKIKADIKNTEEELISLGFLKGTFVYEYDTYYNGDMVDLKETDKALRIREHKDIDTGKVKYVLNFKGPKIDDSTMSREETQFEIPAFEHGNTVLTGLGYHPAGNVEKTRIHYHKDDITCCLDNVTGLGGYLEVEIMAEDENAYSEALKKISSLLAELGFSMGDTVRHSYLSMLEAKKA